MLYCNYRYCKIQLHEAEKPKTAFTSHAGTYQWRSMPFGLCNAPETFHITLYILFSAYRRNSCLVYLDDLIIFSDSFEEHVVHVRQILTVLQDAGLSQKLKNFNLFSAIVDYLGHVIRPGKLDVSELNVEIIAQCTYPETQTPLCSFM